MHARRFFQIGMVGLLLLAPAVALAQQCFDDALCVITEERENVVQVYVENLLADDIIVVFDVGGQNFMADAVFPHHAAYPGKRRTFAFKLYPKDARHPWRYSYRVTWRKVVNQLGCQGDLFCIETEERDAFLDVYVRNLQPFDVTVALDFVSDHVVAETPMPHTATYPGRQRTWAFRMRRKDQMQTGRQSYTYRWAYGRLQARPDGTAYLLPYASGKAYPVMQGFNGAFSHQGKYAIDWDMPERTPVHAARSGIVIDRQDRYREGGLEERLKPLANYVMIQHADGTIANYVHLAPNGVFVTVGQRVAAGQLIGVSGNTGYASGPHLHFEVFTITETLERRTIPVKFMVGSKEVAAMQEGHAYTR